MEANCHPAGVFAHSFRYIIPTTLLRPQSTLDFIMFLFFWVVEEDSRHCSLWSSVMIESGRKYWLVLRERRRRIQDGGICARAKSNCSLISSWFAYLRREISAWRSITCSFISAVEGWLAPQNKGIAASLHAEQFTRHTRVTANFNARLCFFF